MIRKYIAIPLLVLVTSFAYSQGIYRTLEDYNKGVLTYQKQGDEKYRLRADMLFSRDKVEIKKGERDMRLNKSEIFGYRDENGQDYRFFNNERYKIIDRGMFVLYSREENKVRGKEKTRETVYYFSDKAGAPLAELNRYNLKKAYPRNREFHDLLDMAFQSDRELLQYDKFNGEYRLERVMKRTM